MGTFKVGDPVSAVAFTDCFGKPHAKVDGLTVRSVQHVGGHCPHDRLNASAPSGYPMIEGAEPFFAKDGE